MLKYKVRPHRQPTSSIADSCHNSGALCTRASRGDVHRPVGSARAWRGKGSKYPEVQGVIWPSARL